MRAAWRLAFCIVLCLLLCASASQADTVNNFNDPGTTPPVVESYALADDTGASDSDRITNDTTLGLTFTFSEVVYGGPSDVVVVDPNLIPITPDSISGWGTDTLVITLPELTVDGEYTVTLKGTDTIEDADGDPLNGGLDEVVHFTLDTTPPVVTVPSLAPVSDSGQFDDDNVTQGISPQFDGAAFDAESGIWKVEVTSDDGRSGLDDAAPFYSVLLPTLDEGSRTVTATAYDIAGNSCTTVALDIEVDRTPPAASVPNLNPASDTGQFDDDNVTQGINPQFDGTAFDGESGVWKVEVTSDDGRSGLDDAAPFYSVLLPTLDEGSRTVTATAYDIAGNSDTTLALAITVERTPPAASVPDLNAASDTGQFDNDDLTRGITPQFDGTGSDAKSGVWKVELNSDDGKSGIDDTSPFYSVVFPTLDEGERTITATAYDVAGNTYTTGGLAVQVDRTPPALQGWARVAKLLPDEGQGGHDFGCSVSISGDYAVVGHHDPGSHLGRAYVFHCDGGGEAWVRTAELIASDWEDDDAFGSSVAISGDYAVVGARLDDDNGSGSGSAYVFRRDSSDGTWHQVAKLRASDGAPNDWFGNSVAISGDYALVGAYRDDDSGTNSGSAYVFHRQSGENWVQTAKLTASDGLEFDYFGKSVAISGNYVIVGAHRPSYSVKSGAAYVFRRESGENWVQAAKVTAPDGALGDQFGCSVSISGNFAVVGRPHDNVNGSCSGSGYVFHRNSNTGLWDHTAKLIASDGGEEDYFGFSVSISGRVIIVGAPGSDYSSGYNGSAYVFQNTGARWIDTAKLTGRGGRWREKFGCSVSVNGGTAIVGADHEYDTGGTPAGAAYIFGGSGWELTEDTANPTDKITSDTTPELRFTFAEDVYGGAASDVRVRDPNSDPVTLGSVTGWTTEELTVTFTTPLTVHGEYTVILDGTTTIEDLAGNALNGGTDEEVHFTLDTTPPVVTADDLVTNDTTPQLRGTVIDALDPSPTVEVTVNGTSYAATNNGDGTWTLPDNTITPDLAEGIYDVQTSAADVAGNIATDATINELTIDTTPPVVAVYVLVTEDTTPPLFGTVDDTTASVQVTVDGKTYDVANNGDGTWTLLDNTIDPPLAIGEYDVIATATDPAGNPGTDSTTHELTVVGPPTITQHPQSQTKRQGELVTFSVAATGTEPMSYQWQKNESDMPGATAEIYTISSVQPSDAGEYRCVVSNAWGSATSDAATLTVIAQYTLTLQVDPASGGTTTPAVGDHVYDEGTMVDLEATAETGYLFSHWSGGASGSTNPTTVTMDADKGVTAHFAQALPPQIERLELFYNGKFGSVADPAKEFLAVGQASQMSRVGDDLHGNVTNYLNGITGIRVTFDTVVTFAGDVSAAFSYDATPEQEENKVFSPFTPPTAPTYIVDNGTGKTVVTIAFADGEIKNRWLKAIIDASQVSANGMNLDGELPSPLTLPSGNGTAGGNAEFIVGHRFGDVDGNYRCLLNDAVLVRNHVSGATVVGISNAYDLDKNGRVLLNDAILTRNAVSGTALPALP